MLIFEQPIGYNTTACLLDNTADLFIGSMGVHEVIYDIEPLEVTGGQIS